MRKLIYSCITATLLLTSLNANNLDNQEVSVNISQINEDSTSTPQKTKSVKEAINEYLKAKNLKQGHMKENNKYIITVIVPVGVPLNDKQFNDAVTVAYEEAYMKAQEDLLMKIYGQTISDKATSLFRQVDPNAESKFVAELEEAKSQKEQINTIMGKLEKLAEVQLDNALKKEGVDENKLKGLDVKLKKDLFKKTFTKNVYQGFDLKSLLGSVPIQTFLGSDNKGNAEFGLVMMKSDVTERVAMDMANKRAPRDIKGKGVNAKQLLPETDKDYLKEFGVRIFFDEGGLPSLISYAQYYVGNTQKDDAEMISEDKSMGLDSAKMQADAQISEFLNVTMSASNKNSTSKTSNEKLENEINQTTGEEEVVRKKFTEIIKTTQKNAKASSKMDNAGTDTLYDWEFENENGDLFVGIVQSWSYSQLASAEAMKTGKNVNYNDNKVDTKKVTRELKNVKSGKDAVNTNDF